MLPRKHKRNLYFYQMSWSTNFKVLSVVLLRFIDIIHDSTFLLKLKSLFFTQKLLRKKRWNLCADINEILHSWMELEKIEDKEAKLKLIRGHILIATFCVNCPSWCKLLHWLLFSSAFNENRAKSWMTFNRT